MFIPLLLPAEEPYRNIALPGALLAHLAQVIKKKKLYIPTFPLEVATLQ